MNATNTFQERVRSRLSDLGTVAGRKEVTANVSLFAVEKSVADGPPTRLLVMAVTAAGEQVTAKQLRWLKRKQEAMDADAVGIASQSGYGSGAKAFAREHGITIIAAESEPSRTPLSIPPVEEHLSRRTVLAAAGGCVAVSSGVLFGDAIRSAVPFWHDNEAKAAFAGDESVTVPEFEVYADAPARLMLLAGRVIEADLSVGDAVTAELAIANAGGHRLDAEYEFTVALNPITRTLEQPEERTVVVGPLDSGDVSVITAGPFEITGAGEWTIRPSIESAVESDTPLIEADSVSLQSHAEYDVRTTVAPTRVSAGDRIDLGDALRLSAEITGYEQAIFYDTTEMWKGRMLDVTAVMGAPAGDVFAQVRFTLENGSTDVIRFDNGTIIDGSGALDRKRYRISGGESANSVTDDEVLENARFSIPPIHDATIDSNDVEEAWALVPVPADESTEVTFGCSVSSTPDPEYEIALATETTVPEFELAELDVPSEWTEGTQELAVVVENTGERAGTFRGTIQRLFGDEWTTLSPPLETDLEPGERGRTSVTVSDTPDETVHFRVLPFGREFSF